MYFVHADFEIPIKNTNHLATNLQKSQFLKHEFHQFSFLHFVGHVVGNTIPLALIAFWRVLGYISSTELWFPCVFCEFPRVLSVHASSHVLP